MFNRLSRDTSLRIHYILDQWVPPFMRDCRWLMAIPLWFVFGHRYKHYLDFKKTAYTMTEKEFRESYRIVSDTAIKRQTDLNKLSIEKIQQHVVGSTVLDVGCQNGFLAGILSRHYNVSGVDIVLDSQACASYPLVKFYEENVEALPFPDRIFDTVICTHTLEHVRNVHLAIAELRRVTAHKLIIIVPRQRPYKYTFDLHLNFFPYDYSLLAAIGKIKGKTLCEDVDGDILYVEEV